MRAVGIGLLVLALTGCSAIGPTPTAHPTTGASSTPTAIAVPALVPVVPSKLDAASAKKETLRVSNAIEALIDASTIVHVDEHKQLVPATEQAGEYYGVLRTITLEQPTDPIVLATTMAGLLKTSGWTSHESTDQGGILLQALSQNGWFVLLGGDSTVEDQSVVTVQVASPDLP